MAMADYKKIISDKWTQRAPSFDEDHATENVDIWRQTLKELMGGKEEATVLDVGTGTGFLANMAAELGYSSIGMDFSEGMLEIGRKNSARRGTRVEFMTGDIEALPFEDHSFDAVVNCRVLWLLLDPVKAMKEWKRVLKPGGVLLSFVRITTAEERAQWLSENPKNQYPSEVEKAMPLRSASVEEHLAAYLNAGFQNPEAILLRRDLSFKEDAKPWYVFKGVKKIPSSKTPSENRRATAKS